MGRRTSLPIPGCPKAHLHTKAPTGYIAWHDWAEKKAQRYYQVKCPGCGRYAIWKRKPAVGLRDGSDDAR